MKERNFIYKSKLYPFNIDLFLSHSNNFLIDKSEETKNFHLLSKNDFCFNFFEESINLFIQFCQNQEINITNDNVLSLSFLSKKYGIKLLIKRTDQYIFEHHIEIIDKFLSLKIEEIQKQYDISQYEDIISEFINDFINDDRLLLFRISSLYRIISQYYKQRKKISNDQQQQKIETDHNVIKFLFKYFKKHGIKSSILFSLIEINDQDIEYVSSKLVKLCDKFDFRCINPSFYQIINRLIKQQKLKEEKYLNSIEELRELITNQQILFQNQLSLIYSNLGQIALPKDIKIITKNQFQNFSLNEINIPSAVTTIESNSFSGCLFLKKIIIPSSVKYIGSFAFSNCTSIEQIIIPSLVTKIEDGTFYNCSSLSQLIIHSSITNIGNDVFFGCSSLKTIKICFSQSNIINDNSNCFIWNLNNFELHEKNSSNMISRKLELLIKLLKEKLIMGEFKSSSLILSDEVHSDVFYQILKILSTLGKKLVIDLFRKIESNNNLIDFIDSIFPYFLFKDSNLSKVSYWIPLSKKLIKNEIHFSIEIDSNKIEFNKSSTIDFYFCIIMNEEDNLNLSNGSFLFFNNINKKIKFNVNDDLLLYSIASELLVNSKRQLSEIEVQKIFFKSKEKILNNEIKNPSVNSIVSLNYLFNQKILLIDLIWSIIYTYSEELIYEFSKIIHPIESRLLLTSFEIFKSIEKIMVEYIIDWSKWVSRFKDNTPILFDSSLELIDIKAFSNDKMIKNINNEIQYIQNFPHSIKDFWNSNDLIMELENILKCIKTFELYKDMIKDLNDQIIPQKYQNMKTEILNELNHINDFCEEKLKYILSIINDFLKIVNSTNKNNDSINWPKNTGISDKTNYLKTENIKLFEVLFRYSQISKILNEINSGKDIINNICKMNDFNEMIYSRKVFLGYLFTLMNLNQFELPITDKNYAIFTLNSYTIMNLYNINEQFIKNPQLICDIINNYANRLNCDENEFIWIYNLIKSDSFSSDFCLEIPKFYPNDLVLFIVNQKTRIEYDNGHFFIAIDKLPFLEKFTTLIHQDFNSFGDSAKMIGQIFYSEILHLNEAIPQDYEKLKNNFIDLNNLSTINEIIKSKMQVIFDVADSLDKWKNQKFIFNDISFLFKNWINDQELLNKFPSFVFWICKNQKIIDQLKDRYKNYSPEQDKIPLWLFTLRIMSSQNCIQFHKITKSDNSRIINKKILSNIKEYLNNSEPKNYNWINILISQLPQQILNKEIKIIHDFFEHLAIDNLKISFPIINQIKNEILEESISDVIQALLSNKTNKLLADSLTNIESINHFLAFPSKYIQNKIDKKIFEIYYLHLNDEKIVELKNFLANLSNFRDIIQSIIEAIKSDKEQLLINMTNSVDSIILKYIDAINFLFQSQKSSEINEKVEKLIFYQKYLEPYQDLFDKKEISILSIKYNSTKEFKLRLYDGETLKLPKTNGDQMFYFGPGKTYNSVENTSVMSKIGEKKWLGFKYIKNDINLNDVILNSIKNESRMPTMVFGKTLPLNELEFIWKLQKLYNDLNSLYFMYCSTFESSLILKNHDLFSFIKMINDSITLIANKISVKFSDDSSSPNTSKILNNELINYLKNINIIFKPVFNLTKKNIYPLEQEVEKCGNFIKVFNNNYDIIIPKIKENSLLIPDFSTINDLQPLLLPVFLCSFENGIICSTSKLKYKFEPIYSSKISKPLSLTIYQFINENISCELENLSDPIDMRPLPIFLGF